MGSIRSRCSARSCKTCVAGRSPPGLRPLRKRSSAPRQDGAAFLAAIPRSPTRLNPYRSLDALRKRQVNILAKMSELDLITEATCDRARAEELCLLPAAERFRAPHFCDFILSRVPSSDRKSLSAIGTTLDFGLQQKIEILLRNRLTAMAGRGISNGAVVVLDNRSGEILSLVGWGDFL